MESDATGSDRRAWILFGIVAAMFAAGLAGYAINWGPVEATDWGVGGHAPNILFRIAMFLFPLTGALVASRQPRNAVGWILLSVGSGWSLYWLLKEYWSYALVTDPRALPRPDLVLALSSLTWLPAVGLMGTFLLLLFPNGALPSPRWKVMGWTSAVTLVLVPLVATLQTKNFSDEGFPAVQNPLRIEATASLLHALEPMILLIPLCFLGCAAGLIVRFRRSTGLERLQLKWFAAGAGALALVYLAAIATSLPFWVKEDSSPPFAVSILQEVATFSFALIPVAAGFAILRHRLYDIDVILNRSLVYASLSVILALTYLGLVTGASSLAGDSAVTVAASTLAVAALFQPLQRRVQDFIDHRFYRRKYDAEKTLKTFSGRLRDEIDLDTLSDEVLAVVQDTMQPAWLSLWLRDAGRSYDTSGKGLPGI